MNDFIRIEPTPEVLRYAATLMERGFSFKTAYILAYAELQWKKPEVAS